MTTALVTGASSGIGHAVAARLHRRGDDVIGVARRADAVPDGVRGVALDLADPAAIAAAFDGAFDGGPLAGAAVDVLVHCAGYGDFAPVEATTAADARRQLEVNVVAAAELARRVLPGMRERGAGRIVLVSSIAADFSSPMGGWYHASKAALESVAGALRQEVAGFGIHVSLVKPGVVATPWHEVATGRLVARTEGTPYERMGRATADYHRRSASSGLVSDVDAVVDAIEHAATADRPRTRYLVGKGSRTAVTLPRLLPDRAWDRATRAQFGL